MKHQRSVLLQLITLPVLLAALAAAACSGNTPDGPEGLAAGEVDHGATSEPASFSADLVKNPKLSSQVARLAEAERQARSQGQGMTALDLSALDPELQAMAKAGLLRIDGQGRLQVYIHVATTVDEVAAAIAQVQGLLERSDESAGIVQAQVPIDQLETLAGQPAIKFIRLPDYALIGADSD